MDKKVSELDAVVTPNKDDALYCITNTDSTPTSKQITNDVLFNNINWTVNASNNVTFTSDFDAEGNTYTENLTVNNFVFDSKYTPSSSTQPTTPNKIFIDSNYIYVSTSNNNIKRVALENF